MRHRSKFISSHSFLSNTWGTGLSTFPGLANLSLKPLSGPRAVPILHSVDTEAKGTVTCQREERPGRFASPDHSHHHNAAQSPLLHRRAALTSTEWAQGKGLHPPCTLAQCVSI